MTPFRPATTAASLAFGLALAQGSIRGHAADVLAVPNGSFESPVTVFVNPNIDHWEKPPKPADYDESGGFLWSQLAGVFKNTAATSADHLDNADGAQAMYLFAVPEIGIFQDYDSSDWSHAAPWQTFDVRFEIGRSYALTVGILGGGGAMLPGATLEMSLYYRDDAGHRVTVASTEVVNQPATFPAHTHFTDFVVRLPAVAAADAWAGRHVGIAIFSTVLTAQQGGYWDADNVRLTSVAAPSFGAAVATTANGLSLSWPSESGFNYQVEVSRDLHTWTPMGGERPGTDAAQTVAIPAGPEETGFLRVQARAAF